MGMAAALDDERTAAGAMRAEGRAADAAAQKDWRAEQRLALDEMLPKATGGTRCVPAPVTRERGQTRGCEGQADMHFSSSACRALTLSRCTVCPALRQL